MADRDAIGAVEVRVAEHALTHNPGIVVLLPPCPVILHEKPH
jgi:hypothetical protein